MKPEISCASSAVQNQTVPGPPVPVSPPPPPPPGKSLALRRPRCMCISSMFKLTNTHSAIPRQAAVIWPFCADRWCSQDQNCHDSSGHYEYLPA